MKPLSARAICGTILSKPTTAVVIDRGSIARITIAIMLKYEENQMHEGDDFRGKAGS